MIEPTLSDTDDKAYNCGRLLAVFDDLQMAAHDYKLEGAGVVERYYGAASSAPNTAFGIFWRLHQHHLKKLARTGDNGRGKAEAIKRKIEEIACRFRQPDARFPPEFPRTFDMRAQGRFALGFYQQKAAERQARTAYLEAKTAKNAGTEDQSRINESMNTEGDSNNE
jgi:CRISPR-associated protein Csd1